MDAASLLVAASLVTLPPGTPHGPLDPETTPAVKAWALDQDLLDRREVNYFFRHDDEFDNDLDVLRRRWASLKDAPPLADAARFPDRDGLGDLLALNREFRHWAETRRVIDQDRGPELRRAGREAERIYKAYDLVRDAGCEWYYVSVRREALKGLRELLGDEDYYAGRLPPPVPVWMYPDAP